MRDYHFSPVTPEIIAQLTATIGAENVTTAQAEIALRSSDESHHPAHAPEVIVFAQTPEHVADTLKLAHANLIPVTAWGVGTGLEGNAIPVHGGILLSLEKMTRVIDVHADDFQVTVQPGIGHRDLNAQLARYGLFFPPDPGANASIGGMIANNASGIRTVKYGATKDNVLKMQVALADGRLIDVGSRSIKQASGYDLLHLFIGSEGTLGIITQATLKLVPIPEHQSAVVASFPDIASAVETVVAVRGSGLDPAALEFIDAHHCEMLQATEDVGLTPHPTIFMEFQSASRSALEEGLVIVKEICEDLGAINVRTTTDNTERQKLWRARHHSLEILKRANPSKQFFIMDVSVPISQYPALIGYVEALKIEHNVPVTMIGHAGDGNVHVEFPWETQADFDLALYCDRLIVKRAIELGGTATGEHGVGLGKAEFMPLEHGGALDVMYMIKQALDPNGILNPGKIFPQDQA
jgi:D-lactate dehydrogenase (cytochrome)